MEGVPVSLNIFHVMTSLRDAVGKCLAELGGKYDNMLVVTADVDTSSRIQAFQEAYPDRCYNTGIAEQSLMSVSAGLAHEGFKVRFHPEGMLRGTVALSTIDEFPHDNML